MSGTFVRTLSWEHPNFLLYEIVSQTPKDSEYLPHASLPSPVTTSQVSTTPHCLFRGQCSLFCLPPVYRIEQYHTICNVFQSTRITQWFRWVTFFPESTLYELARTMQTWVVIESQSTGGPGMSVPPSRMFDPGSGFAVPEPVKLSRLHATRQGHTECPDKHEVCSDRITDLFYSFQTSK